MQRKARVPTLFEFLARYRFEFNAATHNLHGGAKMLYFSFELLGFQYDRQKLPDNGATKSINPRPQEKDSEEAFLF